MREVKQGMVFIAGTYGVGKSTLCSTLSTALSIPCFSAGDLISKVNSEKYGTNKIVTDKERNQNILINEVQKLLRKYGIILLAGHFCVLGKGVKVENLSDIVFEKMKIALIILLEAETSVIAKHLQNRDGRNYGVEVIKELQKSEYEQAKSVTSKFSIPIICHKMQYTYSDIEVLSKIIAECLNLE